MVNQEETIRKSDNRILVTENDNFEGYEITDYKGIIWGISVGTKDFYQESYTKIAGETRQKALDELLAAAQNIGANAVINFHFEISSANYSSDTEIAAYGNAVVIRPIENYVPIGKLGNIIAELAGTKTSETNESAPEKKCTKTQTGDIIENAGYKFVVCPKCGTKYKLDIDENGKSHIRGLSDVDDIENGTQIYCLRCGTKFTIPEVK